MNPPKMPIHIGDFLRDTGHLGAAGIGAYILLLFHHWSTGELPDNDEQLMRICRLSKPEWSRLKPTLAKFFGPGWHHGRVEEDLAKARESYEKRAKAGAQGGKAKADGKQSSSIAKAKPEQPLTLDHLPKKDSEADASGAVAPVDHRKRLFDEGLPKLARLTGKGPDACRSFVGKCLKAASDDAIVVLGLIEDAERNQVANPSAWIAARLKTPEHGHGKTQSGIIQAADDLRRKIASFDGPGRSDIELRDGAGPAAPRLLSHG